MKPKISLIAALFCLIMAIIACGPFTPIPPTALPSPEQPTVPATPSPLPPTEPPSTITASPTPEAPVVPTETVPPPTPESLPAAPAHFLAGDPIALDSIRMTSQTHGWGLSGPYVLVTSDGGQTWREVMPPDPFASGAPDKAYGAFLDDNSAWVVFFQNDQILQDSPVWHTIDGGRNWTASARLTYQVIGDIEWAEFAVLDSQNVWMLVRGVYAGAGTHYNHELFHSADGGLTWTSLDSEISDDYTGMVFGDTQFGLRSLQTIGAYENGAPTYDVTTDGGATWESHELPPPTGTPDLFNQYPYCETYQPVLLSTHFIRLLVGCFDYTSPPKLFTSYLYISQDGGISWKIVHLPVKVLASEDTLFYFDNDHALLLGGNIYQSTDGGQTWSFVQKVNWEAQFSFVDPQHGWGLGGAVGEIALVNTINGGRTWALIKPVITK